MMLRAFEERAETGEQRRFAVAPCEELCHARSMRVAEAVVDADVAEEDDLLDEEALCVGVGVVVMVVVGVEECDV